MVILLTFPFNNLDVNEMNTIIFPYFNTEDLEQNFPPKEIGRPNGQINPNVNR